MMVEGGTSGSVDFAREPPTSTAVSDTVVAAGEVWAPAVALGVADVAGAVSAELSSFLTIS